MTDTAAAQLQTTPQTLAPYSVQLQFFAGPMDLLLHLVAQQEVPIEEVKMSLVAEQYLELVSREADRLDLETATEYLVIAATLMAIKSRSLLPSELPSEEESSEQLEETAFFEDLRARLREYELTKQRAMELVQSPQLGIDTFLRVDRKALLPTPEMLAEPEDVQSLGMLFVRLLGRIGQSGRMIKLMLEPVSVVHFMMRIVDTVSSPAASTAAAARKTFSQLLVSFLPESSRKRVQAGESAFSTESEAKSVLIGSFIATLELVKRGLMSVSQDPETREISLSFVGAVGENLEADTLTSEFDDPAEQLASDESLGEDERNEKVVHMSRYRSIAPSAEIEGNEDDGRERQESPEELHGRKEVGRG